MNFKFLTLSIILLLFVQSNSIKANNLQIGVPTVTTTNNLVFTISWDNSWNTTSAPNNWDGVYLFAKYRNCASSGAWEHVEFSTTPSNLTTGSPLEVDNYNLDGKGVIVKRENTGSGNITNVTVTLKMTAPNDGASYDFKVFGIEMVYIPTGDFYLGDGVSYYSFKDGGSGSANTPLHVTSDGALTRGTGAGNIYSISAGTVPTSLPASFPVGYDSVYVMKYEITEGQIVSFMNTLSSDQATKIFTYNSNRINRAGSWPNYTTLYPHRAAGYINWQNLAAYLDWSALRPMTETEYEKICRGPIYPVTNEHAWGTNLIEDVTAMTNDGTTTERNTNVAAAGKGKANYGANGLKGPMRSGFASTPTSNRLEAGATYYGVMEMTGNAEELCINVYHVQGRNFTRSTGDGYLTTAPNGGYANETNWPSLTGSFLGVSSRGGSSGHAVAQVYLSSRYYYYMSNAASKYYYRGGRGLR